MKPAPPAWPRLSSAVFYDNPHAAIQWLVRAFGFEVRIKIDGDDGSLVHSELVFGEAVVMVGSAVKAGAEGRLPFRRSPKSVGGGNTQSLMIYVDDVNAHCERARKAGAAIASEPKATDYGPEYWEDLAYEAVDPEGHHWWFQERLRTGSFR